MANTREFLLFTDCTMSNANGDMLNDNRPRYDESTGKLEMSDVRIKRYFRDEAVKRGFKIFVTPTVDNDGKLLDCKKAVKKIVDENFEKSKEKNIKVKLEALLKEQYYDVKFFGAVVTEPKFNIIGPLQVTWSKSIHEAEIRFAQGTAAFTSGIKENQQQGTTWSKYYTPYALFKTYMVYNDMCAKMQNIDIDEVDLENFKDILVSGIRSYKSTSKNQMPRVLVEVIYNKNYIDGELDYIDVKYDKDDLELRCIDEFIFDFSNLTKFANIHKDVIEKVNIYVHPKVKFENISEEFNIVYI